MTTRKERRRRRLRRFSLYNMFISGILSGSIYPYSDIEALFSEEVDPLTVTTNGDGTGSFELYDNTLGVYVAGSNSTSDNLTFAFDPTSDLTEARSYTLFLTSDILSATGIPYNNQDFTFTVSASPEWSDLGDSLILPLDGSDLTSMLTTINGSTNPSNPGDDIRDWEAGTDDFEASGADAAKLATGSVGVEFPTGAAAWLKRATPLISSGAWTCVFAFKGPSQTAAARIFDQSYDTADDGRMVPFMAGSADGAKGRVFVNIAGTSYSIDSIHDIFDNSNHFVTTQYNGSDEISFQADNNTTETETVAGTWTAPNEPCVLGARLAVGDVSSNEAQGVILFAMITYNSALTAAQIKQVKAKIRGEILP